MLFPDADQLPEENAIANRRFNALVIMGMILPFLLVPFLSLIFMQKGQSYIHLFVVSRFVILATLGLMFLYAKYAELQKFFLWSENEYGIGLYIGWIILLYLLCFGAQIVSAIPYMVGKHPKSPEMAKMQQMMKQYPYFGIFTAITAGVTEELFFRGYLMSRLSLFFKNGHWQVIISALLFCSIHIGYHEWGEIIFSFLLGLIFGYHYLKFRNIKILVVVHFMVDAIAVWAAMHYK